MWKVESRFDYLRKTMKSHMDMGVIVTSPQFRHLIVYTEELLFEDRGTHVTS